MKNNTEVICEWPNGALKNVVFLGLTKDAEYANILWNERHADIEGQGRVAGMMDTVPVAWIYTPCAIQQRLKQLLFGKEYRKEKIETIRELVAAEYSENVLAEQPKERL
jgi:hypothetical protein